MTTPAATPRAGQAVPVERSPAPPWELSHGAPDGDSPEVRAAREGFTAELTALQTDIKTMFTKQEERLKMLDRKMISHRRPPLAAAEPQGAAPHRKAFESYVRSGDEDALRGLALEEKALGTSVAADGGYLVDPQTSDRIESVLRSAASLRAISNVVAVESTSYDVLVDHTDVGSGWATESAAVAESDTPQIERISIPLHELSALPKASQRQLDDSAFDIEGWLAARIADKFARAEAQAFVSGDGVDKPKGFLSYTVVSDDLWNWGNLGYVPTGAAGDFAAINAADAIVDLVYALGARYRANGSFVMNSRTAGAVRKMKDADGRFLWTDGLAAGEPARLMGYPVLIAEDMPDIATGAHAIAFGDFAAGYTVADRPDLRILRDPFSAKPHVLFYATKRVGGAVSDFAAIKLLKFSTS
ncbi:HK97 family phage major capsid protein [Brevirhabdus pacifica]|uniref:phage major capsid protein n=1 Tax=Brevirhabdus pacifica TaxID=1267768 RepID=UPI0009F9E518|nr:phage major capsid protein [Brevirhabdus pacifica]PJJ87173.1 HK97 family phage major capsid protein [Brevirhabdus pacifica]